MTDTTDWPQTQAARDFITDIWPTLNAGPQAVIKVLIAIEAEAAALPAQEPLDVRRLGRAIHRVFRHGVHGPGADDGDGDLAYAILAEYARLGD